MRTGEPEPAWGPLALDAAHAGADAIRAVQSGRDLETRTKSGRHDLVTAADLAAEAAIIARIRETRPDDGFLGEESGDHHGSTGVRWLIDPLDGTGNFVHGRADYAVSVGVEVDGLLRAGAILRPADGRWAATDSNGAARSGDRSGGLDGAARSARPSPVRAGNALVCFGLPGTIAARRFALELVRDLLPAVAAVRILGSAACDLLAVAGGTADAFVDCGLNLWDVAAGQAIAAASGRPTRDLTVPGLAVKITAHPDLGTELTAIVRAIDLST